MGKSLFVILTFFLAGETLFSGDEGYPNYPGISVKPRCRVLNLPDLRQAWDYSCGASSLQSILVYYGIAFHREETLCKEMKTDPDWGTEPEDILRVGLEYGLKGEIRENLTLRELERYFKQGKPVIVAYQAWKEPEDKRDWKNAWDDGHYSIVIGIDKKNIYLEDPSLIGERGYIPRDEFLIRWHDVDKKLRKLNQLGIILFSNKKTYPLGRFSRVD